MSSIVEYPNGTKTWLELGSLHREDGPAITCPNTPPQWWLFGSEIFSIPKHILVNYMKANNYTLNHLLTDSDSLVRESAVQYDWSDEEDNTLNSFIKRKANFEVIASVADRLFTKKGE